jgi:hypothetical protein
VVLLINSYDERVLPSIGNEVLKATVAQFDGQSAMYTRMYSELMFQLPSSLRIERLFRLGSGMIS